MRLIFLGTGPAVAIPRPGHTDPQCRDALKGGKSRRTRSSALLSSGRTHLLIDCGPDVLEQLERECIKQISAVLLTHGHSDAVGGLDKMNQWLAHRSPQKRIPIVTDRLTQARLRKTFGALSSFDWIVIRDAESFRIGSVSITPLPVSHSMTPGFPTTGYLFDGRLAYASDVADIPSSSAKLLSGIRTLVLDGAMYFGSYIPSHLSTDAAIRWGHTLAVRRLILTQIGHSYPPHRIAEREVRRYVKTHELKIPERILLAYDGLRLRV